MIWNGEVLASVEIQCRKMTQPEWIHSISILYMHALAKANFLFQFFYFFFDKLKRYESEMRNPQSEHNRENEIETQ